LILYLASTNRGKLREFLQAAKGCRIEVELLPRITVLPSCVEDGGTFEENAVKKALHYSGFTQGRVFADDSGLCVDALGGAPGVYSARFACVQGSLGGLPPGETSRASVAESGSSVFVDPNAPAPSAVALDAANNARLLREIAGVQPVRRTAHYVCVIALAHAGRVLTVTTGQVDGLIGETPRGTSGFGYDPYFFFPSLGKTFAELSGKQKLAVSHRGEAFRKLLGWLRDQDHLAQKHNPDDPQPK
jgi:XTP/dITP diphosphohydrolase